MTKLSRWNEQKKLTSERLTNIYLQRLRQFDSKLRCVITLTADFALAQAAKKADAEIAARKISRATARHSIWCERSAGYGQHRHNVRRRAISQSRTQGGLGESCIG